MSGHPSPRFGILRQPYTLIGNCLSIEIRASRNTPPAKRPILRRIFRCRNVFPQTVQCADGGGRGEPPRRRNRRWRVRDGQVSRFLGVGTLTRRRCGKYSIVVSVVLL